MASDTGMSQRPLAISHGKAVLKIGTAFPCDMILSICFPAFSSKVLRCRAPGGCCYLRPRLPGNSISLRITANTAITIIHDTS